MEDAKNPKLALGAAKPSLHNVPAAALIAMGKAMEVGERKYGRLNYRAEPVPASVYYDAAMRHLLSYWDGVDLDTETKLPHLWLAASNLAILIDAHSSDGAWLLDDRPGMRGFAAEMIADIQQHIKENARG